MSSIPKHSISIFNQLFIQLFDCTFVVCKKMNSNKFLVLATYSTMLYSPVEDESNITSMDVPKSIFDLGILVHPSNSSE